MKFSFSIKKRGDWALLFFLVVAAVFRYALLATKPPHFDEGINGWFTDQLISQGFYRYDPTNYHGPMHFYILLFFKLFMGRNLWALRFSASFFGVASVYLLSRFEPYVGRVTALIAAFLAAVSPGMVFYSRYAIHETELLFFSLLTILGLFRLHRHNDKPALWQIGIGMAGMIVTKETFLVHVGTFLMALGCLRVYEKFVPSEPDDEGAYEPQYGQKDILLVTGVSALIVVVFYTGFFLHFEGVADLFRSFAAWFATGQKGNGHEKPFFYWVKLFWQYEPAVVLGMLSCLYLLVPSRRHVRLLGIYGIGIFLAYSIIPYKTPWCVIELIWPFLIVLGYGFEKLREKWASARWAVPLAVAVFGGWAAAESVDLNFVKYVDDHEPYVYVQTFSDIMTINEKLMKLVESDTAKYHIPIKVFMESNWPLPWLWGDFTKVGYFGANLTTDPDADLVLVDSRNKLNLESRLRNSYFVQKFRLRSAQDESYAYFSKDRFKEQFSGQPTTFEPKPPEPVKPGQGVLAEFYASPDWKGVPVFRRTMDKIDFFWENNQRPLPAPYGIVVKGEIYVPMSGPRQFFIASDDGSDLFIDDRLIANNMGAHPTVTVNAITTVEKGWHKLTIHYNDFGGGQALHLWWGIPGAAQEEISPKNYRIPKSETGDSKSGALKSGASK